jgi:hypothetical protein
MPRKATLPFLGCVCRKPDCLIPCGLCHCKCGKAAPLVKVNKYTEGLFKGSPRQFINGHQRKVRLPIEDAVPFKIDGVYCRLIPLSAGFYAIVDALDYEWLMQWKWTAQRGRYTCYAYRLDWSDMDHPKNYSMHREILQPAEGLQADHENGNGIDNRRKNLRPGDNTQQRWNSKTQANNTSGYPGVSWCDQTQKWKVRINVRGKEIWLGRYASYDKAVEVRKAAEQKYIGEWVREDRCRP